MRAIRPRPRREGCALSSPTLPPRFDARSIEERWQAEWERHGYFRAPIAPRGRPFTIILPPPNVTGILTLGHMLGDTVMDVLVRSHRMRGETTLWLPGLDHAGLATQVEVRRRLSREGVRLESLSRAEILGHVEAWKREHETRIQEQLRAGGFSLDWSRYRYTFDPASIRATREAFVRLYEAGLIYRGERIVNWDPKLRTAISDLEVVYQEESGELLYIRYAWADGSEGGLLVATVRPETIFGDVAIAVHPDDERHRSAVGRKVKVPLTNREIPVITDSSIDPSFGNGTLKITPRHDLLDFEIFRRHGKLPMPPTVLDDAGRLVGDWVPAEFQELDRDDARRRVADALAGGGFVTRKETIVHSVGRSERSDVVIEPLLSTQWFVRTGPLAAPAVAAVKSGEVRIHPDRWSLTFFRWMENLTDWCISRQVAWGHSIPVYYCDSCHAEVAAVGVPDRCPKCGKGPLRGDPDVLDTWFTSWLWPFATLGWPESTSDLAHYYPTTVLVTGRDIMFFWVARMMMAGYYFVDSAPFTDVYFTGMLRDERGRKLSKSLGNSPDPLDVIRTRGADALRFALLFPNPSDQDGAFGTQTLDGARNFLTKLWNLVRFTGQFVPPGTEPPESPPALGSHSSLENRWILSRFGHTATEVDHDLNAFEFTRSASSLHAFIWHDLADRYVEIAKDALLGKRGELLQRESRAVLLFVVERALRLLHPFVPHVTEELWHALPHSAAVLAVARWPRPDEAPRDPEAEVAMDVVLESLRVLRNLRAENRVPVETIPGAWIRPAGPEEARLLDEERPTLLRLARVRDLKLLAATSPTPPGSAGQVTPHGEYFLELPPSSTHAETETLSREREKLLELLKKTQQRLSDAGFRSRAPPEVVSEAEEKKRDLEERLHRIQEHLERAGPTEGSS